MNNTISLKNICMLTSILMFMVYFSNYCFAAMAFEGNISDESAVFYKNRIINADKETNNPMLWSLDGMGLSLLSEYNNLNSVDNMARKIAVGLAAPMVVIPPIASIWNANNKQLDVTSEDETRAINYLHTKGNPKYIYRLIGLDMAIGGLAISSVMPVTGFISGLTGLYYLLFKSPYEKAYDDFDKWYESKYKLNQLK